MNHLAPAVTGAYTQYVYDANGNGFPCAQAGNDVVTHFGEVSKLAVQQRAMSPKSTVTYDTAPDPSVNSLGAIIITGQQTLESRKQEADVNEKRLRLYVQAGLTFLLVTASALYVLRQKKKLSSAEIGTLTTVLGMAVGYWFKQ